MGEITGLKVFLIACAFFGVIIAVNILLAVKAVSTFPGLEVPNSYVASQTFDADRTAQESLGWTLATEYDIKGQATASCLHGPNGFSGRSKGIEGAGRSPD